MWVLLGTSYPVQYSGPQFASVRSTFGRLQHIIQKIVNIHDLVVGHWTLCDKNTKWNNENKCFYVGISLLSHCKSEKSCQITKWCNFLTFPGTQMRKKATRKRPYFTMESAMTAILRDASGKMHYGILLDRRLFTNRVVQKQTTLDENKLFAWRNLQWRSIASS